MLGIFGKKEKVEDEGRGQVEDEGRGQVVAVADPPVGEFEDKILVCCRCGEEFLWEAGEQLFFKERELNEPRRCPDCRRERRIIKEKLGSREVERKW